MNTLLLILLVTTIVLFVILCIGVKALVNTINELEGEVDLLEEEINRLEDKLLEKGSISLADAMEIKE